MASWGELEAVLGVLGHSWGALGLILGHLRRALGHFRLAGGSTISVFSLGFSIIFVTSHF